MKLDTMMAYSEVYKILSLLDEEYKERVPDKVRAFFEEERLKDYEPKINEDVPLTEQNLKRETMVLLAILNLNYWCNTPEEKQEFLDELAKNEKEKQDVLDKYNPDNLFKKQQIINDETLQTDHQLVVYKETNFITRLLNKIKQLFKKNK